MAKILLVEDDEMSRDIVATRLRRSGYEVATAENGEIALTIVSEVKPDLIILDMSMPVLAGWQTAKRLKAMPEFVKVPILALTAHAMAEDRQRALDSGCNDYDTKPVQMPRLLGKMEALLGRNDPLT